MTRFALGAKCSAGRTPARPCGAVAASRRTAVGFSSDARAAVPMPVAVRPKKWRRVRRRWRHSIEQIHRCPFFRSQQSGDLTRQSIWQVQTGRGCFAVLGRQRLHQLDWAWAARISSPCRSHCRRQSGIHLSRASLVHIWAARRIMPVSIDVGPRQHRARARQRRSRLFPDAWPVVTR